MAKAKKSVKKEFTVSEELKDVAEKVIQNRRIDVEGAKIEYMLVYPHINKTTAGRCIKTGPELKFFSEVDYIVEMSGELWDALTPDVREILMEHELKHVMPIMNEKTGDYVYRLRPHDIEDFSSIVNKFGTDWIKTVKLSISSLNDLTPLEEDSIKI